MASIYDIAKIKSGDPVSEASRKAEEASAYFAGYKHQKEIIDEINEAIKEAKKKAKKKKGLFGLGGSILGTGLGAFLTAGASAPWAIASLSGLGAGAGAGIAEKYRQDLYKPTERLKELKKKYKGRGQAKSLEETEDLFEDQLGGMLSADILSNLVLGALMPGTTGTEAAVENQLSPIMGEVKDNILTDVISEGKGDILDVVSGKLDIEDVMSKIDINQNAMYPLSDFPRYDIPGQVIKKDMRNWFEGPLGVSKNISKKIMPDYLESAIKNTPLLGDILGKYAKPAAKWAQESPLALWASRLGGPQAWQGLQQKPTVGRYGQPRFNNPYSRQYIQTGGY